MLFAHLPRLGSFDIVLASGSPRRRQLLEGIGLRPRVVPSTFPENLPHSQFAHAADYVKENARRKADEVYESERAIETGGAKMEPRIVIGADTVVVLDGEILEKPADVADAERMLLKLSGRSHYVYTGVVLIYEDHSTATKRTHTFFEETAVRFANIESVVSHYVATGEPMDKAGGYGYQGLASTLVEGINGCYFNVVGFPINRFCKEIVALIRDGSLH